MVVTLYTTDKSSIELVKCSISHISIFDKNEISLHFLNSDEQLKFIKVCIEQYVLFSVQGNVVKLIPETTNFQRVNYRFD